LKERIGAVRLVAILTAFAGIYLLAADNGQGVSLLGVLGRYELLAIFGAMLGGLTLVLVKKLHDTDSSYGIYFAQCVIGLWIVIIPANIVPYSIGFTGGLLLVADEVRPYKIYKKIFNGLRRLFFGAIVFIITQTTTRALKNLPEKIRDSGFDIKSIKLNRGENFIEIVAGKP